MKKLRSTLLVALSLGAIALVGDALAQEGSATLKLSTDARWGEHVVTDEGRSVYTYVLDEDGVSNCVDSCARNWPAVTVEPGTEPTVGEGLDASLVGTIERADGTVQVTYAGRPLYTSRRDAEAGQTRGQGLGDQFYLVSATGAPITEEAAQEAIVLDPEVMAALMSEGQQVFTSQCAVCHGASGQGGIGPAFAGNGAIAEASYVAGMVLNGFIEHGMPSFRPILSDRQISAVGTFIRNSWGNEFGPLLEEQVAEQR